MSAYVIQGLGPWDEAQDEEWKSCDELFSITFQAVELESEWREQKKLERFVIISSEQTSSSDESESRFKKKSR